MGSLTFLGSLATNSERMELMRSLCSFSSNSFDPLSGVETPAGSRNLSPKSSMSMDVSMAIAVSL